ncbi:MAG: ABC transporter ATP-binding protein [Lachnospiraceae bacterium]|jgi:ABC-2 type transport system ATP-binding protein|uniref:ABC transporter ATP-binding protein n=1 Tax=Hominisplanchenecus murintestinalis TaxID=2941517 RepID=UPI000EA38F65|nr:ABC transporter ATP-binding protein [Hominisplanchenecus murintestinalis]MCI9517090.1 ABC transporter ATP-binding protein [Lachnospiraceae bacterium]RKJ95260.1 ABC transporter ATP-binding protein [Anaerotruncus sp. 1XD22-93]MCI9662060.1 ABC transporter ATP-binding protein [Lachnospiraceae bacterium]NBH97848.1 ABC transporter ATP-binding protein [Lachnospiraceae bacterium]NBI74836.1 ABC transporter ATP-binding protein [Lachnospiraceae bacterium]
MEAVRTISLTKYYGKSRGIKDINLAVPEGDFFGFIGPNGAGKSTTIRTLLGLISPSSGTAEIFGQDIRGHKDKILSDIGYMPSEANFYPAMKVREVIRFSAELRGRDCSVEAARLCERLELDTGKKIGALSLGNRKKVSIVCALQHKPKLCIFDEPTSGLDPLMQREFYAILEERNAQGAAIFLSSHVLSEVQRHCRHAAVIREGEILVVDSMEHLGKTRAKRVTLRGVDAPPALEGIRDVKKGGDAVNFLYSGSPEVLLNALAALPLTDVTITEPDLEEIFMHYYREGEK